MAMASVRAEGGAGEGRGRGKRNAVMAGNWKLNPKTLDEARTLAALVGAAARDGGIGTKGSRTDVFVCPPAPFVAEVARTVRVK
jgi:triosephosphate isomerase